MIWCYKLARRWSEREKAFPFLHGPRSAWFDGSTTTELQLGRVFFFPSHPFGPGFFVLLNGLFRFESLVNGSVGWKRVWRWLAITISKNEPTDLFNFFLFPFRPFQSCHSDRFRLLYWLCLIFSDVNGRLAGLRLDAMGLWVVHVQLWFVGESQKKASESSPFFFFLSFFLSTRYYYDDDFPPCNLLSGTDLYYFGASRWAQQ
jgi:hypothetical protein